MLKNLPKKSFLTFLLAALSVIAGLTLLSSPSLAQTTAAAPATADSGHTAWMLVSTALVLLMLLPGLSLFYAGMVRRENALATLAQCFTACCVVSLIWVTIGYSLAFTSGNGWIGGFDRILMRGLTKESLNGTIPETVFMMFQLTFALITPAILIGAITDRVKFSAILIFTGLWTLLVYAPLAHWVWGPGGFLGGTGVADFKGPFGFGPVLDFAGGTVVHISSGIAGLVAAIVVGPRKDALKYGSTPYNIAMSLVGACLLWVGWFGFNAGSALAADGRAGMALAVTHFSAAAGGMAWMLFEWRKQGKPSIMGMISGAIAGLVAITPASGFVNPGSALIIGATGGLVCYWAIYGMKEALRYDDALDAFGIHGVAGIWGAILTGIFADQSIGGAAGWIQGNANQVIAQLIGVGVTIVWCAATTYILLKVIDFAIGLRVEEHVEESGLDLALHGQRI